MRKTRWMVLSLVALAGGWGTTAAADQSVEANVVLGAGLHMDVESSACSNKGGPQIKLGGELFTGGLKGKLRAENAGGVHGDEVDAVLSAKLTSATGEEIEVPKQGAEKFDGGGAGGNPFIWFVATDADGKELGTPALLGRCVQGLSHIDSLFNVLGHAEGDIGGSCSNNPGPEIRIEGSLLLGGVDGHIIFTNQDSLDAVHRRDELGRVTFEIIPDGGGVVWPKQPFKDVDGDGEGDGVTGNPLLYFTFTDDYGYDMSKEFRLGRCNKL